MRFGVLTPCAVRNLHITSDYPKFNHKHPTVDHRSLTDNINSRVTHILYIICPVYCILTIIMKKKHLQYCKKSAYKWICAVHTHVVRGSAVLPKLLGPWLSH